MAANKRKPRMSIRIPEGMKKFVEKEADRRTISMNTLIQLVLENWWISQRTQVPTLKSVRK